MTFESAAERGRQAALKMRALVFRKSLNQGDDVFDFFQHLSVGFAQVGLRMGFGHGERQRDLMRASFDRVLGALEVGH